MEMVCGRGALQIAKLEGIANPGLEGNLAPESKSMRLVRQKEVITASKKKSRGRITRNQFCLRDSPATHEHCQLLRVVPIHRQVPKVLPKPGNVPHLQSASADTYRELPPIQTEGQGQHLLWQHQQRLKRAGIIESCGDRVLPKPN